MAPSLFLRQAAVRLQLQQLSSCPPRPTTAGLPPAAAAAFSGLAAGFSSLSRFAAGAAGARPLSAAVAAVVPPLRGGHHHQSASPLVAAAAAPPLPPPPAAAAASSSASLGAAAAAAAAGILRPRGRASGAGAAAGGSTVSSRPAAAALRSTWGPCGSGRFGLGCTYTAKRTYLHFNRTLPEDFELPADTMPSNVGELLSKNPKDMDFFENYWYWKLRGEATVLDPESLPKKSYKQLARDMGMQVVNEETEHMVGLLELYEHLKTATFVGPFGTIEKPVLCPSVTTDRIVGCTGGAGDKEHVPLWFRCREGFLYRCGECDQIFMLVRVFYSLPDGKDPFPVDPDVDDVFDAKLLEKGERMWNSAEYVHWPAGHAAYSQLFLEGKWGNAVPEKLSQELRALEA